jgi:hypothetical protein
VLGLAVLSLLYFAQAREVKRLREWAGRSPERAADLQERVQADAQRRAAVAAQPAPARHLPGHPAAPAQQPATAAGQAGTAAPVGAPAAAAAAATAAGAATKSAGAAPTPTPAAAPGTPPTTVQPAASPAGNGVPPGPVAKPGQPLRVPPAQTPPPATPRGASASPDGDDEGPRRPIVPILAAVAAVVAVGLVLVLVVFNGNGDNGTAPRPNTIGPAAQTKTTSTTPKSTSAAALKPSAFTTAVLNGTTTPGLARGVANRLSNAKFKTGNVTNAADQSHSATIVQYAPAHKKEALEVAKAIDVKTDAVQPIDQGSQSLAGTEAIVVVTVGADQLASPQQQTP